MYSPFQLAKKYFRYYLTASNGKGHGVHSPFVFDFINNVLKDKKKYPCYTAIEKQRQCLLQNTSTIEVEDFGAGSAVIRSNKRVIRDIAASSLKPTKFAQLLFRTVQYYKPATILELGTSLGITSSYLAKGNNNGSVFTCEGSAAIAAIAQQNFETLQIKNIQLTKGDFAKTLQPLLNETGHIDLAFIDGNHRKAPTLQYFSTLLNYSTPSTILIFDDIHWSEEMEAAWADIRQHRSVTLTIDLFFIGLVFINPDFKVKQHFAIRF
ncbi:MAG: class I SAM-dependent methyltransferase [Chitinophagaceae bacterium]|nr:class I SAM-dependent methyltransferase [Chitinophagaceae bacterium]